MPFTKLSAEIQLRIWKLTWRPRIISFGDEEAEAPLPVFHVPKSAHVNREARQQTLAQYELVETRTHNGRPVEVRCNYALDTVRLYPGLGAFPEIQDLDITKIERVIAVAYQLCGTSHQAHDGKPYETYLELASLCREQCVAALDESLLDVFPSLQQLWITAYKLKDARRGGSDKWWRGSGERAIGGPHLIDYRYSPSTGHVDTTLLSLNELAPVMDASARFWSDYPDTTPEVIARIDMVRGKWERPQQGGWLHRWEQIEEHSSGERNDKVRDRLMWRLVTMEVATFLGNGPEFQ
ncbi:hypothetical protein ACHAQH_003957 [Verticillium albo-atrum]